ncbi:MAG TPA: DPP IV N-terminal domain-containing protein [Ferruginibacter sp.]|nr:DPP IV N-terminal domain-containing protein [Ferruginibacter sp.]
MKKILFFTTSIFLILNAHAQFSGKTFTTADYDNAVKMLGAKTSKLVFKTSVQPNWLDDGGFWYKIQTQKDKEYVLINPKKKTRQTAATYAALFPGKTEPKASAPVWQGGFEVLSPDKTKAAFIRNWNLWVKDVKTNAEKQLSFDGTKDYGYATNNAGWTHSEKPILLWSPDSKKIATFQQDQRHVKDMYLVKTTVGAPELEQWKYPLPGDSAIIMINRVVIDIENSKLIRFKMPADARRSTLCDDIACNGSLSDTYWSKDGSQVAFVSVSRDHKKSNLRVANALTGDVRDVFEETVPTQYESGQGDVNWKFLPASNEFIWYSERNNFGHLYLYDLTTGHLKNQITNGSFTITRVIDVDEEKRTILFEACGSGSNPYYKNYYSINFNGKNLKRLTPADGNHSIIRSPDNKYFIDTYSSPNTAPQIILSDAKGKKLMDLETADISQLLASGWQAPIPFTFRSANNAFDLYGLLYLPPNIDATKKYPVINNIYPGPQGGTIGYWGFSASRSDCNALAQLGFIVVQIEGSCNPYRSKAFHDACYGDMAINTLPDQIAGIKQLQKKYTFIDLDHVGVWGHSGGGFATASAMFQYPEFYKVGIAESGNHDNRNYEDDWGERYIGLLVKDSSGNSNYSEQANQVYAKNLKGKLLLIHGGMDDNVPPYNTYLVADALIKANKSFDMLIIPNARHGYGRDSYYAMRRRWDYFIENLMGGKTPDNYVIKP